MIRAVRSLFAFLFLSTALSSFAATDPVYTALRAVRPDAKSITLNNFTFDRDVFHVTLNGTLVPLQQVEGKSPGAVFIGTGTYELKPASNAERKQLSVYAGDDKLTSLSDTFDSAIFLGTSLVSAAEKSGAPAGGANASANDKWDDYLKKQKKTFREIVEDRDVRIPAQTRQLRGDRPDLRLLRQDELCAARRERDRRQFDEDGRRGSWTAKEAGEVRDQREP